MKKLIFILLAALCLAVLYVPLHANLLAIGKVTVSSAGTPVQVYSTTSQPQVAGTVLIQYPALKESGSANTGQLYVGTSNLNKTGRVGVACVLNPGDSCQLGSTPGRSVNPTEIYLDADTSGAEAQASVVY